MNIDIPYNIFALNENEAMRFRDYWLFERNKKIIFVSYSFWGAANDSTEPELLFSKALAKFQKYVIW